MSNSISYWIKFTGLLTIVCTVAGCSDTSREGIIEQNVRQRVSVAGEEYENASIPFETVTDDDIKYLADHHPTVRQLLLGPLRAGHPAKWRSVEQVSDEGLRHLGRLHDLESINSLSGSNITDEGLAHLSSLERLQQLDLRGTKITGLGFEELAHLESLTKLWLPKSISPDGIKVISELQHVRVLSIFCNQDFSSLGNMKNLERLEINGTENGTDYGWLPHLENIDELFVFSANSDIERAFEFIGQMELLESLSLSFAVNHEAIKPLSGCESLEEVYFSDCSQLSSEAVQTFEQLPRIERLRLQGCQKELVLGLTPLAGKGTLTSLSLSRSHIDDEVIPILSKFKHLRFLDLNGTQLTLTGCEKLYEALAEQCKIKPPSGAILERHK